MLVFTSLLWGGAGALVLATLLPLTKLPLGAIEGLAFPRAQFLVTALLCAAGFAVYLPALWAGLGIVLTLAVAVVQTGYIAPFTPLWSVQSVAADAALKAQTRQHIDILTANVKMSNRAYGRLIDLVRADPPDVVLAIEVDADWLRALQAGLGDLYPHWICAPQDNGYGMAVLSRLALGPSEQRALVTEGVPSIRTKVTLKSGDALRLYVVHPEPPVVHHDTLGRDSEIALVGLEAAEDTLPVIVSGDLNDVAWSTNTRRFQRLSQLLDPRVGRGFFNTFSATHPWMRWPLDHLFHDARLRLVHMARLPKIGSDHFPMRFKLALAEAPACTADPGSADAQERHETRQMIRSEQARSRRPVGEDWEAD